MADFPSHQRISLAFKILTARDRKAAEMEVLNRDMTVA